MEEIILKGMEKLPELLEKLIAQYPTLGVVLTVVGSLVFLAQIVVLITPNKDDDAKLESIRKRPIINKLINLFLSFAPFQKKHGQITPSKE